MPKRRRARRRSVPSGSTQAKSSGPRRRGAPEAQAPQNRRRTPRADGEFQDTLRALRTATCEKVTREEPGWRTTLRTFCRKPGFAIEGTRRCWDHLTKPQQDKVLRRVFEILDLKQRVTNPRRDLATDLPPSPHVGIDRSRTPEERQWHRALDEEDHRHRYPKFYKCRESNCTAEPLFVPAVIRVRLTKWSGYGRCENCLTPKERAMLAGVVDALKAELAAQEQRREERERRQLLNAPGELDEMLLCFELTGNPVFVWRAFARSQDLGLPPPEPFVRYLLASLERLNIEFPPDGVWNEKSPTPRAGDVGRALAEAFEFQPFPARELLTERQMPLDKFQREFRKGHGRKQGRGTVWSRAATAQRDIRLALAVLRKCRTEGISVRAACAAVASTQGVTKHIVEEAVDRFGKALAARCPPLASKQCQPPSGGKTP